jgi:micrococcal nuclease
VLVGIGIANVQRPGGTATKTSPAPVRSPAITDVVPTTLGAAGTLTTVESITDGDTLRTAGGLRVRLIGIDTPEVSGGKQCFADEAKGHLARLVPPGSAVRLVYDKERQDRFGRDLAYVYRAGDGTHVNLAMVVDGYAKTLTIKPNTAHAAEFAEAASRARVASLAIWAACPMS